MKRLLGFLKLSGGQPDFDAARERFRSSDEMVRMRAIESLRRSDDPRATDLLFDALGDGSHRVANLAIERLSEKPTAERVARLIKLVAEDDTRKRLRATKVLHRLREPRAAETLAEALQHAADRELREEVIEALGDIGGAHATEALILRLEDDTEDGHLRSLAANGLAQIGDPDAIEPLRRVGADIGASDCEDDPLAAAVEVALDQLRAMHPGFKEPRKPSARGLLKRLDDTDATERRRAAEALGRRGDREAVESLITRLSDVAPAVRAAAATSLGQIGDRRAIEPLARLTLDVAVAESSMLDDRGVLVCDAVAAALGALGGAAAESALLEAAGSDSADVRMPAAAALRASARSRRTLDVLARLLDDPSPDVSCAAIVDLSDWKRARHGAGSDYTNADVLDVLGRASQHADAEVRFQALRGLNKFWKTQTAQRLVHNALGDVSEKVRVEAIWTLAGHRASDVIPRILEMLRDDREPSVRAAAAESMGLCLGRAEDMDALIAALDDPDWRVRVGAAGAVGAVYAAHQGPHRGAIPRLMVLAREPHGFVREAARRALATFGVVAP